MFNLPGHTVRSLVALSNPESSSSLECPATCTSDCLPATGLAVFRPSDKPLQVELDGPEVLMEPLREQDAIKRRQAIADAMKDTQVQYAESTAADMKK